VAGVYAAFILISFIKSVLLIQFYLSGRVSVDDRYPSFISYRHSELLHCYAFMPFYSVFGVYRVSNKKFFSASRNVNKNYNNYCLLDCY
jgi:hypothetical protein